MLTGGRRQAARRGSGSDVAPRTNPPEPAQAATRLIQRADLLASLERATAAKVTVISAPAGSGKTSLLRAWADGPGQQYRLAVVPVRRDQQDSQQFWLATLSALRRGQLVQVIDDQEGVICPSDCTSSVSPAS